MKKLLLTLALIFMSTGAMARDWDDHRGHNNWHGNNHYRGYGGGYYDYNYLRYNYYNYYAPYPYYGPGYGYGRFYGPGFGFSFGW